MDTSGPGADYKYREDINLEEGARLFDFSLHYTPSEKFKKLFDRLDINVYNFGGDPFETFRLSIQKYGKYRFQYDRKKAAYFYHDLHQVGGGDLYDLHTFNFDRTMDSGLLKVWLGKKAHLYLNFDRYTKQGNSTTTFDISRTEFEFDQPINEDSKQVALGLNLNLNRYSFVFEEKIQDYENANSLFLPGYADGGASAGYPTSLYYFSLSQPYDVKTYTHTFKFNARPFNSLLIAGSARIMNLEMDLTYSEEAEGINYLGRSFMYNFSGQARFDRLIRMIDLDITYLLLDRLAVIGAVRYHDFEQDGYVDVADYDRQEAALNFDTLGFEGGLQYQFSPEVALTLGYRNETRDLEGTETATYEFETKRQGLFGNLKADLAQILNLTLDYQRGDYENPYTLISPTDFNRLRFTAKLRLEQLNVSGSYQWKQSKSEIFENLWESTQNRISLRAGYHAEKAKLFVGYSLIDTQHQGDRSIAYPPSWSGPSGTFLWEILYEGKSHLADGSLSFDLDKNWKLGGYFNRYWNRGFWEISRSMLKGYLEYTFESGIIAHLGYRYVNFKEESSGYNDYKASILEISFGYRWQ